MTKSFYEAEHAGWMARATGYDAHFTAITDQVTGPILARLGDLSSARLLDVCCGPGHLVGAARARGADAVGLDFAASMIAVARGHYPDAAFVEGDAADLPFPNCSFDHVVCAYGVMHLPDADAAIAQAFRVLRPGGSYVLTQWATDDDLLGLVMAAIRAHGGPVDMAEAPAPMRFSDPQECRRSLAAAGFDPVDVARVVPAWTGERPEDVLRLIMESATRAAMMIEAQEPGRRKRIEAAIVAGVRDGGSAGPDGRITLHRPSVLAEGRKPS